MPNESDISDILLNWPKTLNWSISNTSNGLKYERRVIQIYRKKEPILLFQESQAHRFEEMVKQFLSKTVIEYSRQSIIEQKGMPLRLSENYECVGMGYTVFFPKYFMISIENCDETFRGEKTKINRNHLDEIKQRYKSHFPDKYILVKENTIRI